jgi:hypothetical protein
VRAATDDYRTTSPWILSFIVFVFGPVVALRLITLYYAAPAPHWRIVYPYEYSLNRTIFDLDLSGPLSFDLSLPWPQDDKGIPGWYRQGLAEVRENHETIKRLTGGDDLGIVLAAAIANQGNSPQRPFGWTGLERLQVWIGQNLSWLAPEGIWFRTQWNDWFIHYSIGVGQLTRAEVERLGYAPERLNLFNDSANISLMHAKLDETYQKAIQLGLSRSDALLMMLVSNNDEFDTIAHFQEYGYDIEAFLAGSLYGQQQLARMMTYVHYLHVHEGWPLPADVDWNYLRQMANTSWEHESHSAP